MNRSRLQDATLLLRTPIAIRQVVAAAAIVANPELRRL